MGQISGDVSVKPGSTFARTKSGPRSGPDVFAIWGAKLQQHLI